MLALWIEIPNSFLVSRLLLYLSESTIPSPSGIFDTFDIANVVINYDSDTFTYPSDNRDNVDGGFGGDEENVIRRRERERRDLEEIVIDTFTENFWYNHKLAVQFKEDVYAVPIVPSTLDDSGLLSGHQCVDMAIDGYPQYLFGGPLQEVAVRRLDQEEEQKPMMTLIDAVAEEKDETKEQAVKVPNGSEPLLAVRDVNNKDESSNLGSTTQQLDKKKLKQDPSTTVSSMN